jgi:hypothetical protein
MTQSASPACSTGGVFSSYLPDDIDAARFGPFAGEFNLPNERFNIFHFIHSVVIDGIAICNKLALRVPITNCQRGHSKKMGNFLDHEVFFRHTYLYQGVAEVQGDIVHKVDNLARARMHVHYGV